MFQSKLYLEICAVELFELYLRQRLFSYLQLVIIIHLLQLGNCDTLTWCVVCWYVAVLLACSFSGWMMMIFMLICVTDSVIVE